MTLRSRFYDLKAQMDTPVKRLILACLCVSLLNGCAAVAATSIVSGAIMANDRRPVSVQIDDHGLEVLVADTINKVPGVREQARVVPISMNGHMLLIGQVPSIYMRDEIIKAVQALPEINKVHEQLRIGNYIGVATRSNDSWITTKVKSRMLKNSELNALQIKVITENGEVFLLGLVKSEEADLAVELSRTTAGVRRVIKVFEYF